MIVDEKPKQSIQLLMDEELKCSILIDARTDDSCIEVGETRRGVHSIVYILVLPV